MAGINKVIILGNLGNDVVMRYTQGGEAIATLSIATSQSWKDKQTGEQKEKTEWHRVVIFGKLAEIAGKYLAKGSKVYIEGKLVTRKWQNEQQQDQYTTEIVLSGFGGVMQMLDSKQEQGGNKYNSEQQNINSNAPRSNLNSSQSLAHKREMTAAQVQTQKSQQEYQNNNPVDLDEIPF